jgi:hypothetical protein
MVLSTKFSQLSRHLCSQAHRPPRDRVLPRSTSLRSAFRTAFGQLPPPCASRGPASATPGVRKTSRRSCRPLTDPLSVGRVAPASEGFCSSRSPFRCGGTSPARMGLIGFACGEIVINPPLPPAGESPSPLPSPPPRGEGETGGGAGEDGTAVRRLRLAESRVNSTPPVPANKPWHTPPTALHLLQHSRDR